jgi:hypothetical protein
MNNCVDETPKRSSSDSANQSKARLLLKQVEGFVVHASRTFSVLEAALCLIVGGMIGEVFSGSASKFFISTTIGALILYLPLLVIKIRCQWTLPAHLFENLNAVEKLREIEVELQRKTSIDIFVDDAIRALNSATCNITNEGDDSELCRGAVQEGLEKVLTSVINRPQQVLDCNMALFSVGALVNHGELVQPYGKTSKSLVWQDSFLVFRDDLGLLSACGRSPWDKSSDIYDLPKGARLDMRHSLEHSMHENRIDVRSVSVGNKRVQLISAPIPLVCDEDAANGVIWIGRECVQEPPSDAENILRIFGRIAANWLSKYNECVSNRWTSVQAAEESPPSMSASQLVAPELPTSPLLPTGAPEK